MCWRVRNHFSRPTNLKTAVALVINIEISQIWRVRIDAHLFSEGHLVDVVDEQLIHLDVVAFVVHHGDEVELDVDVDDALEGHVHDRLLLFRLVAEDIYKLDGPELRILRNDLHFLIGLYQMLKLIILPILSVRCVGNQIVDLLGWLPQDDVRLLFLAFDIVEAGENKQVMVRIFLDDFRF